MDQGSRREFLRAAGATLTMVALPSAMGQTASAKPMVLRAGVTRQQLQASGTQTEVWSFNGSVPGPILRYRQGDRVRIAVHNQSLPQSTTVHWHGLRVPNAMDGVPQVTQDPIPKGGSFNYEFDLEDSGTFWYHPHQASFEQVGRGLYGLFIVDEKKPIEVDRDIAWVLSDFKLGPGNQQVADFGRLKDFAGGGRLGNLLALNGKPAGAARRMEVRSGERIRLRLLNASTARIFLLAFEGHAPRVISYDGQAVEPHELPRGLLVLGPGMRTDLILDCMGSAGQGFSVMDRRDRGAELARIVYSRQPALRSKPMAAPIAIAPNPLPEPDASKAIDHDIVFEGGLLGKPAIGLVDGKPLAMAEIMAKKGLSWTMNYQAEHEHAHMHTPLLTVPRGEHVMLKMVNETEFEHPMHLHGHVFRVLKINDRPTRYREWRDTVMIGPNGSADVLFVADNPGEWMFHCHILEHAAGGMMGTIAVAG